jgi:hypothetical protein
VPTATPAPTSDHSTPQTALTIGPGGHAGTIARVGDVDFYRFPVTAPSTISIDFKGTTLRNGVITLFVGRSDGTGLTQLSEAFDDGSGARIIYTTQGPGAYFIRVKSRSDTTGQYGFGLALAAR